jgi:hypothetical protein
MSFFFGVLTLLLCVMWVRSYRQVLVMQGGIHTGHAFSFQSKRGTVQFHCRNGPAIWYLGNGNTKGILMVSQSGQHSFEFVNESGFVLVRVPHWFLTLLSGAACSALYSQWSYRFSLRAMLIATTLVAIVLGIGVWLAR